MRKLKAFSLIEILVVLGVFFTVVIIVLPIAISQLQSVKAENAMKDIKSAIFLAQQNAFTNKNNKTYGIAILADRYILYSGSSLATADIQEEVSYQSSKDIQFKNVNFAGGNEVHFAANSFRPDHPGTLDIADGNQVFRITVSSEGLITSLKQ